jgi:hypothetical protein
MAETAEDLAALDGEVHAVHRREIAESTDEVMRDDDGLAIGVPTRRYQQLMMIAAFAFRQDPERSPRLSTSQRFQPSSLIRYRQTQGAETDMLDLTPPRHTSTPPMTDVQAGYRMPPTPGSEWPHSQANSPPSGGAIKSHGA